MSETMPHWLDQRVNLSVDKIAIECPEHKNLTFKMLQIESMAFAKRLKVNGINQGDKVAILSNNSRQMIIAIFAMTYIGSIAVMLNTKLTKNELDYQIERSDTKLLVTTEDLQAEKQLAFQAQYTFKDILKNSECDQTNLLTEIDLTKPFTMMFTSGTTGRPKAVVHTYGNHWWNAISSALNLGLEDKDKWLLTLPIFHIGGFSVLVKSVIYGMTVYLVEKYKLEQIKHAFEKENVTMASIVTVMLKDLLKVYTQKDFPKNIRCLLLGGGAVPESLLKKVEKQNLPLFQSYGMTETTSQIATINGNDYKEKIGSSGKPLFPAEIKIENNARDGVGEIYVKGPTVFSGYYGRERTEDFQDGWFKTGDLGYIDKEGFLYVVDRRKDLIISGGENIYPSEIEHEILSIAGVKEVAVVGKTDERWGQVPIAYVVKSQDLEIETIQAHLKNQLATFKNPKEIIFLDELPRTASNKVKRHALSK